VLSVWATAVDYTKGINHLPELESLVSLYDENRSTGGPGLNIAINLRRPDVEYPVEAIRCIGNDAEDEYIIKQTA
jgi:sugar/nucleoside kinase (ribokinase family)